MFFAGIDIGTQSIRLLIGNIEGNVIYSDKVPLKSTFFCDEDKIQHHEQDPNLWIELIEKMFLKLKQSDIIDILKINSICVDGTSGTIIPVDNNNKPLINAIMYNDRRSEKISQQINKFESVKKFQLRFGYKFSSSYALPKILWIKENREIYEKTSKFFSPTDYINSFLTKNIEISSDFNNVLKMGYDLRDEKWPDFFINDLDLDLHKLPKVVSSGTLIGKMHKNLIEEFGFNNDLSILAGTTDGNAAVIASGAIEPGDIFCVIGTTLVTKAISSKLIKDELGRFYCHKHPMGFWLPGGASNVGTSWINCNFSDQDLDILDKAALKVIPTDYIIYPLEGIGERFPIINKKLKRFVLKHQLDSDTSTEIKLLDIPIDFIYPAFLEGIGYVLRYILDLYKEIGINEMKNYIYVSGGASGSDPWMQILSDIIGKEIIIPKEIESAFAGILFGIKNFDTTRDLINICKDCAQIEKRFFPNLNNYQIYSKHYQKFKVHLLSKKF